MIKRVTIHMLIDDQIGKSSSAMKLPFSGFTLPSTKADEEYAIELHVPYDHNGEGTLADTPANRIDTAAHEIGHILSGIFSTKGGVRSDPRATGERGGGEWMQTFGPSHSQALRLWCSELQAWAIAEKISPNLDQVRKARSLQTYRAYLDQAELLQRRRARRKRLGLK